MRIDPTTGLVTATGTMSIEVGDRYKGEWSPGEYYRRDDVVLCERRLYVALADQVNHQPTSTTWWEPLLIPTTGWVPPDNGIPAPPPATPTTPTTDTRWSPGYLLYHPAGIPILRGRGVMVGDDGRVKYADRSDPTTLGRLLGIATNNADPDQAVEILTDGEITLDGWGWDQTKPVYLQTEGQLSQARPTTGYLQIVGVPIASNQLYVRPEPSTVLI